MKATVSITWLTSFFKIKYLTLFESPTVEAVSGWEFPFCMVESGEAGGLDRLLQHSSRQLQEQPQ